jgi:predicted enzyme related to lactoylglutathione lyase
MAGTGSTDSDGSSTTPGDIMPDPNFVILYVDSPAASAAFYARLLDRAPIESSPTFAMFALREGTMLGLWSKHTVAPAAQGAGGGAEIAFTVEDAQAVAATHALWREKGLAVIQPPTDLDFGRTFVAVDPDGHRLRVFAPAAS